ncbi:enoyl-CoA hydratase/isomerase family protein [uncultured Ruegeria sp.]|uniref:enoyl-CoA hydratase/isomerase family protein n=1 Tax=uncultured Ruegeria sp. TaxID=259304 RepID=UPI00260A4E4A|nr:enoyl-CoA hydratase/isomerase family protein [uncultured Ruegeria sp.]
MILPVVTVEQAKGVLTLTLNRPKAANALSLDMAEAILAALEASRDVQLAVIKGGGRNYCAGFDLSDVAAVSDGDLLWRFVRIEAMLQAVHHAPFPTLALAQGHAIGAGADLFTACSQRVMTPDAKLRFPGWHFELALGSRRLTRLVGRDFAQDILIDARTISAQEAAQSGLASAIAPQDNWPAMIDQFMKRTGQLPAFSVQAMRGLTTCDSRAEDMAAVVATAGRPGLKKRILGYQAAVASEREKRRQA